MFFTNGLCIPIFNGDIGGMTKSKLAKYENSRTFMIVFARLINMALDYRYRFNGLPDTIDERVLKQSLLWYGNATLFTLDGVPVGLPGGPDGSEFDIYGNAGSSWVFSKNGKINLRVPLNYKYTGTAITEKKYLMGGMSDTPQEVGNGVIIWENKTRMPFVWTVIYFAERIADTLRTLDLDRRWLKRPFIPRCEESEAASFDESLKKFMNNEDFSYSLKARNIDKTDIFSVDLAPELITHVTQLAEWYESQFRMLCGIDANSQVDKKGENLICDEVNVDNVFTDLNVDAMTEYINEQLETFNKLTSNSIRCTIKKEDVEEEGGAHEQEEDIRRSDSGRDGDISE